MTEKELNQLEYLYTEESDYHLAHNHGQFRKDVLDLIKQTRKLTKEKKAAEDFAGSILVDIIKLHSKAVGYSQ